MTAEHTPSAEEDSKMWLKTTENARGKDLKMKFLYIVDLNL